MLCNKSDVFIKMDVGRIERVEQGMVAYLTGMRVGDYIVFVGNQNVVKMEEEEVLKLIQ